MKSWILETVEISVSQHKQVNIEEDLEQIFSSSNNNFDDLEPQNLSNIMNVREYHDSAQITTAPITYTAEWLRNYFVTQPPPFSTTITSESNVRLLNEYIPTYAEALVESMMPQGWWPNVTEPNDL